MQKQTMLYPPQADILNAGFLNAGFNCIVQMPTGSGKTWLAEHAFDIVLAQGHRAIYLTPLRALAGELHIRWQQRFSNTQVGIFTGDYGHSGQSYPIPYQKAQLLLMTPERLDSCLRSWRSHWDWIPQVDLVVVDELHLLADTHRGPRLEATMLRLRRLNPFLRFLCLSATLGNREQLADWLDGVDYHSSWRPIPLSWRTVRYRKATEKPKLLADEIKRTVSQGGKSLVFVQSRRRAEALSHHLQKEGLRAAHHHAGLNQKERQGVEAEFRQQNIDAVVATATLEMGLNLPVRQVILYDLQQFDGEGFRPLSTIKVWQRAGRAGRPGLDKTGEVVLLTPTWERKTVDYTKGEFEPIRSGLSEKRALAEQVIVEIASGFVKTKTQLKQVLTQTIAAQQNRLPNVDTTLDDMVSAGMITNSTKYLKATPLGYIATRHFLTPATVLHFARILGQDVEWTFFDLLLIISSCYDCQPILTVGFEELDSLTQDLMNQRSVFGHDAMTKMTDVLGIKGKRLLATLKMALVSRAWTSCGELDLVAHQYDCYPFEVHRLLDSLKRLLLAIKALLPHLEIPDPPPQLDDETVPTLAEKVQALLHMLETGLDEETVTLTRIKGLGPIMARQLQKARITDIEALALADPKDLAQVKGLSQKRATEWIETAVSLTDTYSAYYFHEHAPTFSLKPMGWPTEIDPYRLRRALDLTVKGVGGGQFLVSGGLEPHRVRLQNNQYHCDCMDAYHGHLCKHIFAVRLHRQDPELHQLVNLLQKQNTADRIDLYDLWFGQQR